MNTKEKLLKKMGERATLKARRAPRSNLAGVHFTPAQLLIVGRNTVQNEGRAAFEDLYSVCPEAMQDKRGFISRRTYSAFWTIDEVKDWMNEIDETNLERNKKRVEEFKRDCSWKKTVMIATRKELAECNEEEGGTACALEEITSTSRAMRSRKERSSQKLDRETKDWHEAEEGGTVCALEEITSTSRAMRSRKERLSQKLDRETKDWHEAKRVYYNERKAMNRRKKNLFQRKRDYLVVNSTFMPYCSIAALSDC